MVKPVSGTEHTTNTLPHNTGEALPNTTRTVLKLNCELQKQIIRMGRNKNRSAQPPLPTPRPSSKNSFDTLHTVIRNRPEAAINLFQLLSRELASENYGMAKLYRAFETNNFNDLPTVSQLTDDLANVCAIDLMPDKTFVEASVDKLISGFIQPARTTIENGGNVPPQQLLQLANLSTVLLKALGKLSDNTVTTIGSLETAQLENLIAAYDLALQTAQPNEELNSIEAIRNLLERKRNAITTVQEFPLELENLDESARSDRDVVMRAVQIMGWSLSFASEPLQNDKDIVLAALQNSQISIIYMSPQFQRDPELRAIAFPRHEQH